MFPVAFIFVDVEIGTFQLMGTIFYIGVEASDGFNHLVGVVSQIL